VASIETRDDQRDADTGPVIAQKSAARRPAPKASAHQAPDEYDARGTHPIAGAHLSHDVSSSSRDPLIPYTQDNLGISLSAASRMVPAQTSPSLLQPFIRVLADRLGGRAAMTFSTLAGIMLTLRFTTMSIVAMSFGGLAAAILSLAALAAFPFLLQKSQPMPRPA